MIGYYYYSFILRRRGHRSGGSGTGVASSSGGEPDALSDSMSHNSIQVWPCRQQSSQSTSLRSSSGSNGSAVSNCAELGIQESMAGNNANSQAGGEVAPSGAAEANCNSQTPSCRALAGSLASFDASSGTGNAEGEQ